MKNQFQYLTETKCNELLKLLKTFKVLFNGTLGTWITDSIDFEVKKE